MRPLLVAGQPLLTRFGVPIDVSEPVMEVRVQYADEILGQLGDTPVAVTVGDLVAWATAEGGGLPDPIPDGPQTNEASNNPFNTTEPEPGGTTINSAGVQSYPSYPVGMQATITTLLYPDYAGILSALKEGADGYAFADAVGATPWGTPGLLIAACVPEAQAAVAAYWKAEVEVKPNFIKASNGNYYELVVYPVAGEEWREVAPGVAQQWVAAGFTCLDDSANLTFPRWGVHKA